MFILCFTALNNYRQVKHVVIPESYNETNYNIQSILYLYMYLQGGQPPGLYVGQ